MARIAGVDLPKRKHLWVALTYIYGIGKNSSLKICEEAKLDPTSPSDNLTENDVVNLRRIIDAGYKVEGDLRRDVSIAIKRLMDLGCYRGLRHRRGLPARGQRSKTNARTRKGPRRSAVKKK